MTPMQTTGTTRIQDLPVLDEVDSPDFGADLSWVDDDLYKRPYTGLYRTSWDAPAFFRNAEVREIASHKASTHQTIESMSAYWQETAPAHCQGLVDTFNQTSFSMRAPEHLPTKKLTSRRLTTGSVARFQDAATAAVRARIDELGDGSQVDFFHDFTKHVVADFWAEVLGLTTAESFRAIDLITDFQLSSLMAPTEDQIARASASSAEYVAMVGAAINREIAKGERDLLNELQADFVVRDPLARVDDPGRGFAITLLDAFHTFSAITANAVHALLSAPAEHEHLRQDRSLVHEAYQEGTRLHPAPMVSHREALYDFEYEGIAIEAGTPLFICWGFANRDPLVWDDPTTYRLGRGDRIKQMTFGGGVYVCSGRNAVRLMVETVLQEITEPGVRVEPAGDVSWVGGSSIHELHEMPVTIHRG